MAAGRGLSPWVVTTLLALCALRGATLEIVEVDMMGPGCANQEERVVSSSQTYRLLADFTPADLPAYRGCNVTLRTADVTSSLQYTLQKFAGSANCGVLLRVYEDPQRVNFPGLTQSCGLDASMPQQRSSVHDKLKFSLHRNITYSSAFLLEIVVTAHQTPGYAEVKNTAYTAALTDDGDDAGGSDDPSPTEGEGGGLNIGVVVGIAIAAIILVIALVGLAIYCCLRNRDQDFKDMEAADRQSGTSVFTSGTSQVLFAGGNNQRKGGGGKYGSTEDVRSSSSTDRANNLYSNRGYQADDDEHRSDRDGPSPRDRGGIKNTAFADEADRAVERGGHISRRDSGRGGKFDKKKNFSRHEEYEMSKVSKVPNGILKTKTRSKSPNRSQSSTEGSTVDSNALVYGYSQTAHAHPNTQHIPVLERTRSRSRSRGTSSHRSGSAGRSRSGSIGKSGGKDSSKAAPKSSRQYSDMSHFLDRPKERPRSRSGSMGRRSRSDSKTSDNAPSEVSFAPSGNSSKKNTGGRRVHIQSVETDF